GSGRRAGGLPGADEGSQVHDAHPQGAEAAEDDPVAGEGVGMEPAWLASRPRHRYNGPLIRTAHAPWSPASSWQSIPSPLSWTPSERTACWSRLSLVS